MSFNRLLHRLLSKEAIANCIVGAGGVAFVASYCSHAFLNHRISKFYQALGPNGEPIPVRKTIDVTIDVIMSDLGYTEWNRKFYHTFIINDLEPMLLGSTKVRNGVFMGIPQYCQAVDEEEIKNCVLINKNPVDWESADGDRFLKSLQLSDNALKFLLAKLVLDADNYKILIFSFLPVGFFTAYYGVGHVLYSFFNLLHKPLGTSVAVFSILGLIFVGVYLFTKDAITAIYDKSEEEKIYNVNESYIIGGIEYYQALIERNKALRNLLKNGHKKYSVKGNETSIFRAKGYPVTFKLKLAEEFLQLNYQKKYAEEIPTPRKPHPIM